MSFSNNNMIGSGISKPIRPNSFPADFNSKVGSNHVASLKNITQAKVQFLPQPGQATTASGSSRLSTRTQNVELGTKVRNVRGGLNKNEANNEKNSASPYNTHDASVFNDIFNSLDSGSTFINKNEHEALDFMRKEVSNKDFDKLQTTLADPNNEPSAVDKAKQIFVILKMLSDFSAKSDTPNSAEIKADIKFYVDNINKHGLGIKSPFAGSLLQGDRALKNIDDRVNKNSAKLIAEGLNYNAAIDRLVESKINTVQDKNMRATLLSKWKEIAFRPSKQIFDKMEGTINGSSHFHRVDALLNHQPIKLELFKDFLQRENVGQNNDAGNTGTPKPDNGMAKETPGPTYIYYDYSTTTNDNSIHFTDKSHLSMKEAANPPKGQEEKSPASATASATQHQNITTVPEKQSDRSTDGRGDSGGQQHPEATAGTSDITVNSNKPSNETQTPPATVGGHAGFDDIDGPALQREASATSDINAEQIVQSPEPWSIPSYSGFLVGSCTEGSPGTAELKDGLQPATTTQAIRPQRSRDENLKAGENPVSNRGRNKIPHAASLTRRPVQFAKTSTKAKSHAAIVQSSEPRPKKWDIPSHAGMLIGSGSGGALGASAYKDYWQPANIKSAETTTQTIRSQRSRDENLKAGENPVSNRVGNQIPHTASLTRQPAQFAKTSAKAKSHAAIVQSSEPRPKKWDIPSHAGTLIGSGSGGALGASAYKGYRQPANIKSAETTTQAIRREPLQGRDEKELLTNSNSTEGE